MTTISSVLPATISGYFTPPVGASVSSTPAASTASVIASFGNNSTAPLTYNAAGLIVSSPTAHVTAQAAQADYLAAQSAMDQSLASLMSGSSSNSSGSISSTTDIFGTNSTANDPSGILNTLLTPASTTTPTPSSASNAQSAYLAAQNVVSQSLSKLTA